MDIQLRQQQESIADTYLYFRLIVTSTGLLAMIRNAVIQLTDKHSSAYTQQPQKYSAGMEIEKGRKGGRDRENWVDSPQSRPFSNAFPHCATSLASLHVVSTFSMQTQRAAHVVTFCLLFKCFLAAAAASFLSF